MVNGAPRSFGIKTFVNVRTAVAENLLQFHEVPLRVQTSAAEKWPGRWQWQWQW